MDPFTILNEVNTRFSVIVAIEYETHFFVRAYVRTVGGCGVQGHTREIFCADTDQRAAGGLGGNLIVSGGR